LINKLIKYRKTEISLPICFKKFGERREVKKIMIKFPFRIQLTLRDHQISYSEYISITINGQSTKIETKCNIIKNLILIDLK